VIVGVVAAVVLLLPLPNAPMPPGAYGLIIDFGIGREPRTGSQLADVCASARTKDPTTPLVEGPDGTCAAPSAKNSSSSADRPAILSTTPLGDFRRCDTTGETDVFPTDQLTTTSELVGVTGLRAIVRADPVTPFPVSSGSYCGRVIAERSSGRYQSIDVLLQLDAKDAVSAWSKAVLALLVGAGVGLGIRLLNDPFSKLLPMYRRLRAVRRWFATAGDGLPDATRTAVNLGTANAEEAIRMLDVEAAEVQLTHLEGVMASPQTITPSSSISTAPPMDDHARGIFWLLRRYWLVAFLAVVLVVAATGLLSQYVNNVNFHGTMADWAALVGFGLAAQVTIQGVTEALGKLAPSSH
jgi:hypothetical protein